MIVILIFQARDADNTSEVSYSVIGGNAVHLLTVDSHTGEIRVADKNGLDVTSVHSDKLDLVIQVSKCLGLVNRTILSSEIIYFIYVTG